MVTRWSADLPAQPGYYWMRLSSTNKDACLVSVADWGHGRLGVEHFGSVDSGPLSQYEGCVWARLQESAPAEVRATEGLQARMPGLRIRQEATFRTDAPANEIAPFRGPTSPVPSELASEITLRLDGAQTTAARGRERELLEHLNASMREFLSRT